MLRLCKNSSRKSNTYVHSPEFLNDKVVAATGYGRRLRDVLIALGTQVYARQLRRAFDSVTRRPAGKALFSVVIWVCRAGALGRRAGAAVDFRPQIGLARNQRFHSDAIMASGGGAIDAGVRCESRALDAVVPSCDSSSPTQRHQLHGEQSQRKSLAIVRAFRTEETT